MCKNSVIKKLAFLAFIGAAIGGLVILFKKFEKSDSDLSAEEDDACDSCSSCSDACRSYTTLSGDSNTAQSEPSEKTAEKEKETVDETNQEAEHNTETI